MTEIQDFTYHCHTNFSDGANSIEEMIAQAKKIGFSALGISDHLIVHKNTKQSVSYDFWRQKHQENLFHNDFAEILESYQRHCDEIRKISRRENIKIYIGFEVDFYTYSGWYDEMCDFLSKLDYDYVHSGNHMLFDESCENVIDISYARYALSRDEIFKEYAPRHFQTIGKAAASGMFKFIAHIDYIRKIDEQICDNDFCRVEKENMLKDIKQSATAIELSTKGLRRVGDFFPNENILKNIAKLKIPVVISDDAHSIAELGKDFALAENKIKELNISNRFKLR